MKARHLITLIPCIVMFIGCSQPQAQTMIDLNGSYWTSILNGNAIYPQEMSYDRDKVAKVAKQVLPVMLPTEWKGDDRLEEMATEYITMTILRNIENGSLSLCMIDDMIVTGNYAVVTNLLQSTYMFSYHHNRGYNFYSRPHHFNNHRRRNFKAPHKRLELRKNILH